MYVLVRDYVGKCTERSEGEKIYQLVKPCLKGKETIRIDFDGIQNVTDDFIYGFLGSVITKNRNAFKRIFYVRSKTYIRTKIRDFSKKMGY